jgi:hypothetical protein
MLAEQLVGLELSDDWVDKGHGAICEMDGTAHYLDSFIDLHGTLEPNRSA